MQVVVVSPLPGHKKIGLRWYCCLVCQEPEAVMLHGEECLHAKASTLSTAFPAMEVMGISSGWARASTNPEHSMVLLPWLHRNTWHDATSWHSKGQGRMGKKSTWIMFKSIDSCAGSPCCSWELQPLCKKVTEVNESHGFRDLHDRILALVIGWKCKGIC